MSNIRRRITHKETAEPALSRVAEKEVNMNSSRRHHQQQQQQRIRYTMADAGDEESSSDCGTAACSSSSMVIEPTTIPGRDDEYATTTNEMRAVSVVGQHKQHQGKDGNDGKQHFFDNNVLTINKQTTAAGADDMNSSVEQQQQQQQQQQQEQLSTARQWLYLAHFAAQFSQNAWQFALVLMLAAFSNYQSLLLISTYGLISQFSVCCFGASSGRWVDRRHGGGGGGGGGAADGGGSVVVSRLYVARCFVWIQKSGVLLATALCYLLLKKMQQQPAALVTTAAVMTTTGDEMKPQQTTSWLEREFHGIPLDPVSIALLVGIHVFGSLEAVLDKAFLVLIEREWVVIMSQAVTANNNIDGTTFAAAPSDTTAEAAERNKTCWLSETNVFMKQISLGCQVIAPAVTVFVVGAFDTASGGSGTTSNNDDDSHAHGDLTVAAILVAAFNVASLAIEYICTARIYHLVPPLRDERDDGASNTSSSAAQAAREESSSLLVEKKMDLHHHLQIETSSEETASTSNRSFCHIPSGLKTYLSQPISMAGLGLALL
jgi:Ferroportin1 (FPN1)